MGRPTAIDIFLAQVNDAKRAFQCDAWLLSYQLVLTHHLRNKCLAAHNRNFWFWLAGACQYHKLQRFLIYTNFIGFQDVGRMGGSPSETHCRYRTKSSLQLVASAVIYLLDTFHHAWVQRTAGTIICSPQDILNRPGF